MRPLVASPQGDAISILDQTLLPHREVWLRLQSLEAVAEAIRGMRVRGAPLIGVTAAYGLSLALRGDPSDQELDHAVRVLGATRPTAVNLGWALTRVAAAARTAAPPERAVRAFQEAETIAWEDVAACRAIGDRGLPLLQGLFLAAGSSRPVQVLTHCNAGWLAALEYGTALAPVYRAHEEGLPVHVWVDETRPRNQGWLTAWELGRAGVPHTVVTDNASGHLLQEQAGVQEAAARAAVLLVDLEPVPAQLGHLGRHLVGVVVVLGDVELLTLGEVADGVHEVALLVGQP